MRMHYTLCLARVGRTIQQQQQKSTERKIERKKEKNASILSMDNAIRVNALCRTFHYSPSFVAHARALWVYLYIILPPCITITIIINIMSIIEFVFTGGTVWQGIALYGVCRCCLPLLLADGCLCEVSIYPRCVCICLCCNLHNALHCHTRNETASHGTKN